SSGSSQGCFRRPSTAKPPGCQRARCQTSPRRRYPRPDRDAGVGRRVRKGSQSLTPAQPLPGSVTLTTKAARTPAAASAVTRHPVAIVRGLAARGAAAPTDTRSNAPSATVVNCLPIRATVRLARLSPQEVLCARGRKTEGRGTRQILPPLRDALGEVGDDVQRERSVAVIGHRDHPTRRDRSVVIGDPV